ncbi:MAG: DUF2768 domain-containing protein [Thermobacillus sp. ZCTH02-B1]|nr:MAG: DUF2768 domain-containing protein [Thermobacillus sp. ZCTH02-B1]
MNGLTTMWIALSSIGLMVLSAVAITFARLRTKGFMRILVSTVAVLMLLVGSLLGLIVILA